MVWSQQTDVVLIVFRVLKMCTVKNCCKIYSDLLAILVASKTVNLQKFCKSIITIVQLFDSFEVTIMVTGVSISCVLNSYYWAFVFLGNVSCKIRLKTHIKHKKVSNSDTHRYQQSEYESQQW